MMDLKVRILEAVAAAPSPLRAGAQWRQVTLIAGSSLTMATVYWMFAMSILGWQQASRPLILLAGTSTGAAAVAGSAVALSLGRPTMLGRSRRWLILVLALAPVGLLVWKIVWSAIFGNLDESPRLGYRCLRMSLSMGAIPVLLLVWTRRGQDPRHPGLLGTAIGVAVGACGWVLVDLWCPVAGIWHLLRGHVLPVVLLGVLGAAIGSLVMSVRRIW